MEIFNASQLDFYMHALHLPLVDNLRLSNGI